MNSEILAEDFDDDIFVIKQVKPINKLTLQEALLIKHNVLNSLKDKSNSSSLEKSKPSKKTNRSNENAKEKKKKTAKCNGNVKVSSSSNSIDSFFPSNNSNLKKSASVSPKQSNSSVLRLGETTPVKERKSLVEDIRLSPGISHKRKRFSLPDYWSPEKSPTERRFGKLKKENTTADKSLNFHSLKEDEGTIKLTEANSSSLTEVPQQNTKIRNDSNYKDVKNNSTVINEINFTDNGTLLCFLLKKIISDVTKQQLEIESNEKSAKPVEKLLLEKECDILENFFKLDDDLCKLYVRLLCRKNDWHRVSSINFKDVDINMDLNDAFEKLYKMNLIDNKIENEELEIQLNFLKKHELRELCRLLNISSKPSSKKLELIKLILQAGKNQKSIAELFGNNKKNSLSALIKNEVQKNLGLCIRLGETAKSTFTKILVLFSFPHFDGEEETRLRDQLYLCMNVHKCFVKFVNYKVLPTVVFCKLVDFEEYCKALMIRESFEVAILSKKFDEFLALAENAESEFVRLLNDEKYCERFKCLESFLKRFSAGYIYGKILTKFCETFKKQNNKEKVIEIMKMLLSQRIFLSSKRGKWYEILTQTLENLKDTKSAAEVLIEALKDPGIDEIQKLTLQCRAQAILKKKTSGLTDAFLRDMLEKISKTVIQNPSSIEIRGRSLQENKSGFKAVYIQETNKGKMFTSVEELAISYYKTTGFTKGYHTEGYIIQCLYALIFFDIIYGPSPLGTFQSAYQDCPLDFYSKSFYLNRKEAIDCRLKEMCDWTEEDVELHIKKIYYENFNTTCVILWKENFTPELFCEVLKCISLPVFAVICRRLLENVRVTGFPDLTLWNPETLKCKFVEVKSPNDRLSSAQRVWLDFLKKIGIDCEVCNVKNTGRKFSL